MKLYAYVFPCLSCLLAPGLSNKYPTEPAVAERLPNEGEDLSSGLILLQGLLRQRDAPLTMVQWYPSGKIC